MNETQSNKPPEAMSLMQVLTTRLRWRQNLDVARARRAFRALRVCERRQEELLREEQYLLRELQRCRKKADAYGIRKLAEKLASVVEKIDLLNGVMSHETMARQCFVFSSWMLQESFRICTSSREEGLHFILGVDVDGVSIGTRLATFPYAHRSISGATGDRLATHRVCIETHEAGHRIMAMVHSHPGTGPHATHHSMIDHATHHQWESTTRMIGGVWSRDGYLRWFSTSLEFKADVIGTHMEQLNEDLWKLHPEEGAVLEVPSA